MADKCFDELFLAAKLHTCIYRLADGGKDFFIFTVAVVIFFNQHQYVVDIDFHLLNQLDFKFDIVRNIFLFCIALFAVLVVEVKIDALIILQIPCGNTVHFLKLVKGRENISHTEDSAEQSDKIFLCLVSDNLSVERIFSFQFFKQIYIAGMILAVIIFVTVPVIIEAL